MAISEKFAGGLYVFRHSVQGEEIYVSGKTTRHRQQLCHTLLYAQHENKIASDGTTKGASIFICVTELVTLDPVVM
jgi:hypothetical protein